MRGPKDFLPLLLLAVATRAIPLPEPRSIAMVSAHAAVERSAEGMPFDKREIRGDLDTAEAEMEMTTIAADELEVAPAEGEVTVEPAEEDGGEEASETGGSATTERVEAVNDGPVAEEEENTEEEEKTEEEEEKTEEDQEKGEEEEEKMEEDKHKMEEMETEKPEEKGEGKKDGEDEKFDGRIGEEEKHGGGEGLPVGGEEDAVKPEVPEEDSIFPFGPFQGPFPWPLGPISLDHPTDDLPDHEIQQVGNDVYPPGKVIFPIYFIRIDHRYLEEPPYQGL